MTAFNCLVYQESRILQKVPYNASALRCLAEEFGSTEIKELADNIGGSVVCIPDDVQREVVRALRGTKYKTTVICTDEGDVCVLRGSQIGLDAALEGLASAIRYGLNPA